MNLIEHFIDGKIVSGTSDRKGKVFNPAIGKQESEVRLGTKQDLDLAVSLWPNLTEHIRQLEGTSANFEDSKKDLIKLLKG